MNAPPSQEVTQLLLNWSEGDKAALSKLIPLVHQELNRLAHNYMSREQAGHTLQTTALVNEAYLRLVDGAQVRWQNRAHFFAVSANIMRRILVDFARRKDFQKRGGTLERVSLDEALLVSEGSDGDLFSLDQALNALATLDQRKGKVVELRFFGGLTEEETAEVLQVSPETVRRDWRLAKMWLLREMSKTPDSQDKSGEERRS